MGRHQPNQFSCHQFPNSLPCKRSIYLLGEYNTMLGILLECGFHIIERSGRHLQADTYKKKGTMTQDQYTTPYSTNINQTTLAYESSISDCHSMLLAALRGIILFLLAIRRHSITKPQDKTMAKESHYLIPSFKVRDPILSSHGTI